MLLLDYVIIVGAPYQSNCLNLSSNLNCVPFVFSQYCEKEGLVLHNWPRHNYSSHTSGINKQYKI